ncbi:hypothetical protein HO173_004012 [Letharia columbiana]|uniref:Uncharacterized protein n=1 Tax=Letharia columbiana TaxID=112416 RepID=A0A8H6FZZ1_9LECA|nr:uncharacterized protein HO173_004012 [Letharia columbiana]KAF6237811.1 hypothetical protein HO173_004012 [Letharia columbiana]
MAFLCDLANGGPSDKASKFQDKVSRNAVDYSQPQAGKDLTSCIQLKVKRNSGKSMVPGGATSLFVVLPECWNQPLLNCLCLVGAAVVPPSGRPYVWCSIGISTMPYPQYGKGAGGAAW